MLLLLHKDNKNTPSRSALEELFSIGRLAVWKEDIHFQASIDNTFRLQMFVQPLNLV